MSMSIINGQKQRNARGRLFVYLTLCVLACSAISGLVVGSVPTTAREVVDALLALGNAENENAIIIWSLRLPRVTTAILVGACMALSGALMQGLTRNPLADPTLTGVAAGAACAIVAAQTFWPALPFAFQPILGIAGGLCAATLTFALVRRDHFSPIRLALAGLSVNAFLAAGITTIVLLSGPDAASLFFWLSGGLAGRSWDDVALLWPWALVAAALAAICTRALNIMSLGDDAAQGLGLHLGRWRLLCCLAAIASTAAAVAIAGPLGFVGLCAPHVARLCVGNDHRYLLAGSALFGAALVCTADLLARTVAAPRELPAGFLTALIAAPLLIRLIHTREPQ